MEEPDARVPLTLLTGFLGAGKTTLLDRLLRDPQAGRIAVVMNELGDVGLDHDLIEEASDETILLSSGCLCCSMRGDLGRTLASLMARRFRGTLEFDRVVIETTGIADPGPILQTLVLDEVIAPHYRMDGVVVVVDAATARRTLKTQEEAVRQIAVADLIVLSKTDLATPSELRQLEAWLGQINVVAPRLRADHGRVPGGALFGLSALHPEAGAADVAAWLGMPASGPDPLAGLSGLSPTADAPEPRPMNQAGEPHHDSRICAVSIEIETPIPARVLDAWIGALAAGTGPEIMRIKGIVHLEGMDRPVVVHGVRHVFDAPVPLRSWSGTNRTSRIVAIARDLHRHEIAARLEALRARSEEADGDAWAIMPRAPGLPV